MSNTVYLAMKIKGEIFTMFKIMLDIILVILSIVNLAIANNKISKIYWSVCIVLWTLVTFCDLVPLVQ